MDPNENKYSGVMPKTEEAGIFPPETPPGMAYVPLQRFGKVYEPDTALVKGTIFPELYKPWYGSRPANISNVNMSPMGTMGAMNPMNAGAAVSPTSNPVMGASSNSNDMYLKYLGYNNVEGSGLK